MRRLSARGAVWVAVALTATVSMVLAPTPASADSGPDQVWIVELEPGTDPGSEGRAIARQHGGEVEHLYEHVLNGYSFVGNEKQATALSRHPRVRRVEADQPVQAFEQTTPTGISRIDADDVSATGAGTVVAVIDTGVDLNHPDLAANIHSTGKDCVNNDNVAQDDDGHGTHVAGTIAGLDNSTGVVGVGPGIKIEPVKVLDANGSGSWSGVICGIDHVTSMAGTISVANMSLGGSSSDDPTNCASSSLHQAICNSVNAGVFYSVAAGNDGANASGQVPAKYDQVTTVSALEDTDGEPGGLGGCTSGGPPWQRSCDDALASFSNYGAAVDVIAPGVRIRSTYWNDTYATASGTSMAAPHVAGVAALVRAAQPGLTPAGVEAHLKGTGECPDGSTSGTAVCSGKGTWPNDPDGITEPLVNALAATGGGGSTDPSDPPPPPSSGTANDAISVSQFGGKFGDNHADVTVTITADGTPVANATVSVTITLDGSTWSSPSGTTNSAGQVVFGYRGIPSGSYVATVTNVTPSPHTWDGSGATVSWTKT